MEEPGIRTNQGDWRQRAVGSEWNNRIETVRGGTRESVRIRPESRRDAGKDRLLRD